MIRFLLTGLLLFLIKYMHSQDTIRSMQTIDVKGFETRQTQANVPASISIFTSRDLQRFSNTSLVPVINNAPGVRMEERSPGSYRLSIRGSLLRSPFGVRNVKIYWKDIPLTDAGGNTYLNLLDLNGVDQIEILKGPAGSIYGAGTGGVVTFSGAAYNALDKDRFTAQVSGGSYGSLGAFAQWQGGTEKLNWQLMQSHYQSDGYRENSKMRRDLTMGNINWKTSEKNKLEALMVYGNLAYHTPGGLTQTQMNADPTQARPSTPTTPGASEQQAAVYNKTFIAGITDTYSFNSEWMNSTTLTGAFTNFENPFITNFEKRKEQGIGLRTKFQYTRRSGSMHINWTIGTEIQYLFSTIDSTGNNGGIPDQNLVRDQVTSSQQFLFTQLELKFGSKISVQAALSVNDYGFKIERTIPPSSSAKLDFDRQVLPRLAVLYKLTDHISAHISGSKGYSPPGLAEVRPSAGGIYSDLQAEHGWNYELGIKGSVWRSRVNFDLAVFNFQLEDAIVRRTNASGAEYFINAGGTRQNGIEAFGEAYLVNSNQGLINQMRVWSSTSVFDFVFSDYKVNNNDYSGNKLTGVPSKVLLGGVDVSFTGGFYLNGTFNYTSDLPLTDANDFFADDYRLWQARVGWKHSWTNVFKTDLFLGIDNAGNELYSLGNDINAFGRRFYNPAPERNYYMGLRVRF